MPKDYILLIDKPPFITSQECLQILKQKLQVKKIGHTGTLDPIATGLMVVLVNEATKLSNFILSLDKSYLAMMQLFIRTDSGDISGKVLEEKPAINISKETVDRVFNHYDDSVYQQVVPIYSAVKIKGQKLYEYARKNQPVDLPTRQVYIKNLKLLSYEGSFIKFEVTCSKGTYIRSLINDMAHSFKTIATMASLKRISQSSFSIKDALMLEDVNETTVKQKALSIPEALSKFMKLVVIDDKHQLKDIKHGKAINLPNLEHEKRVLLINQANQPLAIYQHKTADTFISKRGFNFHENSKNT